ncbi:MAG: mechanosensitive ion channel, partial [Cyclobacteriaceae bacterium]|nr:mechanosensitive ion channel [Cyclobacteriaceae bacterium]
ASATDTTKVVKVIEPIPLANIGTETETTLSKIREIREKIKPANSELEVDTLIPQKLEIVEKLKKDLDLKEIEEINLRQAENLKNDINQIRIQLEGWRSSMTKKTEEINALKMDLGEHRTKWDKTQKLEREEKLPQQVTERIQTNLKEINALNKDLTKRNNALLTKQDELTGALIFLDEVLNKITKTEQSYRTQIFSIDSPPIWQMFSAEKDTLTFEQKIQDITTRHNNDLKNFLENYRENIYYHILFFVVLLVLSFYLKIDVAKWSDEKRDETIKSSLHVISKPFSASLLVSLLATGLFYSEAPDDVLNYYYALLVVPILTIVPGLIYSINKKYFYFVGGVFVLTLLANYFSALVVLDRLLLLLLDVVTVVLLITLLRSRGQIKEKSPNVKWGFTFTIMRLSIFLLSISALANGLGNTGLSKIISQGSLAMIYGGTIIYAAARTLSSLFALIIQLDKVSRLNMIQNYSDEVKARTFQIIRWAAVIYWLYITLSGYLIFEPIYDWFEGLITREWVKESNITIGSFLAFFITLWISFLISRFIRFILQDEILTHFEMPRGVPGAISLLVKLVLIATGFILAFEAAGIKMSNITIIFGALGVGIGFGLQNIFNNLISGLILAFERPIQSGDIIQIST